MITQNRAARCVCFDGEQGLNMGRSCFTRGFGSDNPYHQLTIKMLSKQGGRCSCFSVLANSTTPITALCLRLSGETRTRISRFPVNNEYQFRSLKIVGEQGGEMSDPDSLIGAGDLNS